MNHLTEAVVQDAALAYLKSLGWAIAHSRTSPWAAAETGVRRVAGGGC